MNKNKIDILDEHVLDILEDNIKNYSSLENLSKVLNTVPIPKIFYVSYQLKPYLSKETLIDNTISKYLKDIEEQKETYLQNNDNESYADMLGHVNSTMTLSKYARYIKRANKERATFLKDVA